MEEDTSELTCPLLSLSCLRFLVPPIRLISAAIWQTVKQKIVADYGILEEFVFMVTDIVPQILTPRKRAELVFGLRARLILELCHSDATADLEIIQPHLDRMHTLSSLWDVQTDNTDMEISDSHFLGLVHSLLRDPEERENFFQDVFPVEFGPMYDKAIQTLMWQFLSRLEKLLPNQTVQQIASLLSDSSSVLHECMESMFHLEELRSLLGCQTDHHPFEDNDPTSDTCILSALCLPPVERVVIVGEQTEAVTDEGLVYTVCTEVEVESEGGGIYINATANSGQCGDNQQWVGLSSEVASENETTLSAAFVEGTEPAAGESDGTATAIEGTAAENHETSAQVIGEHQSASSLDGGKCDDTVDHSMEEGCEAKSKEGPDSEPMQVDCVVVLERLDKAVSSRPMRQNRGLKMKTYLSQRKKRVSVPGSGTKCSERFLTSRGLVRNRTSTKVSRFQGKKRQQQSKQFPYPCPTCEKQYKCLRFLQQHKCPNQSLPSVSKGRKGKNVPDVKETVAEGEQSSGRATVVVSAEDLPPDDTSQVPSDSNSINKLPLKEPGPVSIQCNQDTALGPFLCPHCSTEFKCKQTMRFHLRNICYAEQQVDPEETEKPKKSYKCADCDKMFKFKSTLESHKNTHNPLYCEACMKVVRDADALAMHKISHTPFQCNECEENFLVFRALHKHYLDVHKPSGPFTCSHCLTTFVSLKRLIRHEWKHTGHQPFQCPHCPKRFRSYSDVLEHQRKHTKEYPFLCWECGKRFRHSITLTRHVQREHRPGQPPPEKPPAENYACSLCSKTFATKKCLLRHENFLHKGMKHPCEHCGKGFSGKDALARHTMIHTGERPFQCDDCQKCFRSASELKIHNRYHTGERPYKCKVCDKGFVQSCFLTLHMRTHTGEKPYVCTDCEKGFASMHGLKRHKKLVHA